MTSTRQARAAIALGLAALPSGFVGSAGSYRSLLAGLVLTRRPYRQGASEQRLVDASTATAYADSGAPDHRYDQLEVEDWVTSGDPVGAPVLRNESGGVDAEVVGVPGNRARMTGFTSTDYVDGLDLDDMRTVMLRTSAITITGTRLLLNGRSSSSFAGIYSFVQDASGGKIRAFQNGTDQAGPELTGVNGYVPGTCIFYLLPDAGKFGLEARSAAGDLEGFNETHNVEPLESALQGHAIGVRLNSSRIPLGTDVEVVECLAWNGSLTATQRADVAAGTDLHSPDRQYSGLRSGVFDPSDTSILVVGDDAGLPVLAP